MTTFVSTVPGAITSLRTHFKNVADANNDLDLGLYLGPPTNTVKNNFISIGDPLGEGQIITNYSQAFQGMQQTEYLRRTEAYGIHCCLRVWQADIDQVTRFGEALRLISSITSELSSDIHGSDQLSPSGQWELTTFENTIAGPLNGGGWGCIFEFAVLVSNVILTASS